MTAPSVRRGDLGAAGVGEDWTEPLDDSSARTTSFARRTRRTRSEWRKSLGTLNVYRAASITGAPRRRRVRRNGRRRASRIAGGAELRSSIRICKIRRSRAPRRARDRASKNVRLERDRHQTTHRNSGTRSTRPPCGAARRETPSKTRRRRARRRRSRRTILRFRPRFRRRSRERTVRLRFARPRSLLRREDASAPSNVNPRLASARGHRKAHERPPPPIIAASDVHLAARSAPARAKDAKRRTSRGLCARERPTPWRATRKRKRKSRASVVAAAHSAEMTSWRTSVSPPCTAIRGSWRCREADGGGDR